MIAAALAVASFAGPALAHDCSGRIDEFERLLDLAAEQAISASSGGQAVAGAREAQAVEAAEPTTEETVVPFQDEGEEVEAVNEAEAAGTAGQRIIDARTSLQEARDTGGNDGEEACMQAVDDVMLGLLTEPS